MTSELAVSQALAERDREIKSIKRHRQRETIRGGRIDRERDTEKVIINKRERERHRLPESETDRHDFRAGNESGFSRERERR